MLAIGHLYFKIEVILQHVMAVVVQIIHTLLQLPQI